MIVHFRLISFEKCIYKVLSLVIWLKVTKSIPEEKLISSDTVLELDIPWLFYLDFSANSV